MKALVEALDFSIAMNFHSYGNLWVTPFNYFNSPNYFDQMNVQIAKIYTFLKSKFNEHGFKDFENSKTAVNYIVNGGASDWMLEHHNIISISPELGTNDRSTDRFYIAKSRIGKTLTTDFEAVRLFLKPSEPIIKLISEQRIEDSEEAVNAQFLEDFEKLFDLEESGTEIDAVLERNNKFRPFDLDSYSTTERESNLQDYDEKLGNKFEIENKYSRNRNENFKKKFKDLIMSLKGKNNHIMIFQNKGMLDLKQLRIGIDIGRVPDLKLLRNKVTLYSFDPVQSVFENNLETDFNFAEKQVKMHLSDAHLLKSGSTFDFNKRSILVFKLECNQEIPKNDALNFFFAKNDIVFYDKFFMESIRTEKSSDTKPAASPADHEKSTETEFSKYVRMNQFLFRSDRFVIYQYFLLSSILFSLIYLGNFS